MLLLSLCSISLKSALSEENLPKAKPSQGWERKDFVELAASISACCGKCDSILQCWALQNTHDNKNISLICCKCKGLWCMCWSESLAIPGYQLLHFSLLEKETGQPDKVHPFSKHDGICTYHDVNCKHIPHFVLFVHLPLHCNSVLLKSFMGLGVT